MVCKCVKVTLTKPKHSFSKKKIEALLSDKRKGKLTIEKKAKYCAKTGDFINIVANHQKLDPKSNDENEIIASASRQSQFHVKLTEGRVDPAIINTFAKDLNLIQVVLQFVSDSSG